jgi:MipA family protein
MILTATGWRCLAASCLLALPLLAGAADPDETPPTPAPPPQEKPAAIPVWEGAIGLNTSYRPEYSGAAAKIAKLSPGFFLRYGRLTITNSSGFVTRRADDVVRGVGLDLVRDERLRLGLALRVDRGRSESSSPDLAGMGDIDPTVRVRLNLGYRLPGPWRLGGSWSVDALGKGGGNVGDAGVSWEHRLTPSTVLNANTSLSFAGDRYMQSYYGVSAEQSARSGYPVYEASAGVRDASVGVGFRTELSDDWLLLGGAGASRLLGPAARSPLTKDRNGWGLNLGLAWRF